jgi:hypothetical protein
MVARVPSARIKEKLQNHDRINKYFGGVMVSQEEQWDDTENTTAQNRYVNTNRLKPADPRSSNKAEVALLLSIFAIPAALLAWLFLYLPIGALSLSIWALSTDIYGKHLSGKRIAWAALILSIIACIIMVCTWIAANQYASTHPY